MNDSYVRYRAFTIDTQCGGFCIRYLPSAFIGDYAAFCAVFGDSYATLDEAKAAIDAYWTQDEYSEDNVLAFRNHLSERKFREMDGGKWSPSLDERIWDTKIDGEWIEDIDGGTE